MNNELAKIIKEKRNQKKYSQQELADLVGVSKSYINKIEHSNTKRPSLTVLNNLSVVLEIDYLHLIEASNYDIEDVIINDSLFNDFVIRFEMTRDDIKPNYTKNSKIDIDKVINDYKKDKIDNLEATYLFICWTMEKNQINLK